MVIDFDDVIYLMAVASSMKINECLRSVKWNQQEISDALTNSDMGVDVVHFTSNSGDLEAVEFNCMVLFSANEVPGIIAPFYCCMHVEAHWDHQAGKIAYVVAHGPNGMVSAADDEAMYDVDSLYYEFSKKEPALDINDFISPNFDLKTALKSMGVKTVAQKGTLKTTTKNMNKKDL